MKVSILGEHYKIQENRDVLKEDAHGLCDRYKKEITLCPKDLMFVETEDEVARERKFREVKRHEIVHAFLFEAGMDSYSEDEVLVQWIATMFPKLEKAFVEADCD